jgi:hypothetical protein
MPPSTIGERLRTRMAGPMASTEAITDVTVAPPSSLGEAGDPREGFVFPWYESSPLFPCTSFDFSSPPRDWEWMAKGLEILVDQAWVPSLDEISDLLIQRGNIQPVPIDFEFPCVASKDWSH